MFHLFTETPNSLQLEAWYLPRKCLLETSKLSKSVSTFFSAHQNFDCQKIPKNAITLIYLGIQNQLRPQLQVSCLPPRFQSKDFCF